jgi:hypothetical protein
MLSSMLAKAGLLATFAVHAAVAASAPHISAVGNKFFYANGTQYFIKGMPIVLLSSRNALTGRQQVSHTN